MLYPSPKNAVFEHKKSLDFHLSFFLVPRVGIEPTLLAEPDFESGASTNSATEAYQFTLGF